MTLPKVSSVRQVAYILAIPLWAGFAALYAFAFFTYVPHDGNLNFLEFTLRILLFGIALEGGLVPFIDRLELKNKVREIRLTPLNDVEGE
jgi:hypothetical protein